MNASELCDSIRADFFSEILPFMRLEPTSVSQLERMKAELLTVRSLLFTNTLHTTATIVERNCFEFALLNLSDTDKKHNVTFGRRAIIRFVSCGGASAMTERIFKNSRNPYKLLVRPAIDGALGVLMLVWHYPTEAEEWLRRDLPGLYSFLNEHAHLQDFKHLVGSIYGFIHNTKPPIRRGHTLGIDPRIEESAQSLAKRVRKAIK